MKKKKDEMKRCGYALLTTFFLLSAAYLVWGYMGRTKVKSLQKIESGALVRY